MTNAGPPTPTEGMVLTHFIVSDDVERSRRFYTDVLGGTLERTGEPTNVALANSWIVINRGGGPTDDKPAVTLQTPRDLDRVGSSANPLQVAERAALLSVIQDCHGNMTRVAMQLGMSRNTLYRRIKRHGIPLAHGA